MIALPDDDQVHAALTVHSDAITAVDNAFSAWLESNAADKSSTERLIDALRVLNVAVEHVAEEGGLDELRVWQKNDLW